MTNDNYTVDSADTRTIAPAERVDYWTDRLGEYQCRFSMEGHAGSAFRGQATRQRTADHLLVGWKSDRIVYRRTAQDIRADPDHDYRLTFTVSGSLLLDQGAAPMLGLPGRAAILDMSTPLMLRQHSGATAYALTIPRHAVVRRIGEVRVVPTGIDLRTGLGRVVADMIGGLRTERHTLSVAYFDAACDRIVDLLCMLILGDDSPTARPHLAAVEASIRRYVSEHAEDPGLDGPTIAAALGWSVRQIQLALQQAGTTPRRLIKEERLERAREHLRNPGPRPQTVTEIAHRFGFSSVSAFSTAFREQYGYRPSEIRARFHRRERPRGR